MNRNHLPKVKFIFHTSFVLFLLMNIFQSSRFECIAATPYLVKDINQNYRPYQFPKTESSDSNTLKRIGSLIVFIADDGINGYRLWRSDGTNQGTYMLPIPPSLESTDFFNVKIGVLKDQAFFVAKSNLSNTSQTDACLWKTDGNSIEFVKNIDMCESFSTDNSVKAFTACDDELFFSLRNGSNYDMYLMKTDGTSQGTIKVHPQSFSWLGQNMMAINGTLFFSSGNDELWKSDGTQAGTSKVKSFESISEGSFSKVGNSIFFIASEYVENDYYYGKELWKSDGTTTGTIMIKDTNTGSSDTYIENIGYPLSDAEYKNYTFVDYNGIAYFSTLTSPSAHFWRSDGTASGTLEVKEMVGKYNPIKPLTTVGEYIFFSSCWNFGELCELYKSDGTTSGTSVVNVDHDLDHLDFFYDIDGMLYFKGNERDDDKNMDNIYRSDGTKIDTIMLANDLAMDDDSFFEIDEMLNVNDLLFIVADDGNLGTELWALDIGAIPATILTTITISGPTTVNENSSATFSASAQWSDGTTTVVTPTWSENSTYTTISSSGVLTASDVSSDQTVVVSASYSSAGITKTDTHTVSILNAAPAVTLTGLQINGPTTVNENSSATFSASAQWSDGTTTVVTPTWSENSTYTTISSSGVLTASDVSSDQTVVVSASYSNAGITITDTHSVSILNAAPAVTLTGLQINGPTTVNENSSATFSASAQWSDGTTTVVTPTWSENSTYTTISSSGVLTASDVSSDQTVVVSASYSSGGITKTETHSVSILNSAPAVTLTGLQINGSTTVNENSSATFSASAQWSDGTTTLVTPTWSENSAYTTISSSGVLTASEVSSDQTVVVSASYSSGGITKTDTHTVSIINSSSKITIITPILHLLLSRHIQEKPLLEGTVKSLTGRIWRDRNLGASRVAISSTDEEAYGSLYQWGRGTDGHEKRTSGTTTTLSTSNNPGHGNFILVTTSPYDWRTPQNSNLWQGVSGVNNPCPAGFRLPTATEMDAERASWASNDPASAFGSPLKLVQAGERIVGVGMFTVGGCYWSSTTKDTASISTVLNTPVVSGWYSRSVGCSVRCIQD